MPNLPSGSERYRIGYAFPPKKQQSFIQDSLVEHAKQRGIDLVPVDPSKGDLSHQGPFHCIIHKLYGESWNHQLKEYSSAHPDTLVLDPPDSIARLHNRASMLDVVHSFQLHTTNYQVAVPKQVVLQKNQDVGDQELGVRFPVIAKPLLANGSANSHEMCLVFDNKGLQKVGTPVVVQEFVNHGGVLFKVYVIGEHVQCVKRRSLSDISEEQLRAMEGVVLPFSQISNSALPLSQISNSAEAEDEDKDDDDNAEMPPREFVEELAKGIRLGLQLNFFNFDVIRGSGDNQYYVIDINYFPGFAKLPSYQQLVTDFLLDLLVHKDEPKAAAGN